LTIKSIDGYQGGEKEYIFVSTVRCNKAKNPGFCNLLNRINVALTRAKKGLIVFGNPDTLTQGKQPNDPTSNIWSKFYPFMLGKNQVLKHE
jgi:superfamily I DNA and/or RNA helicase